MEAARQRRGKATSVDMGLGYKQSGSLCVNAKASSVPRGRSDAVTPSGNAHGKPLGVKVVPGGSLTPLGASKVHASADKQRVLQANKEMEKEAEDEMKKKTVPIVSNISMKRTVAASGKTTPSKAVEEAVSGERTPTTPKTVPLLDRELRRACLNHVYRQLRATHDAVDDATLGRLAASLEMDVCRRSTSREDYLGMLNQEINRLMQVEMSEVGTVVPSYQNSTPQTAPPMTVAQQLGGPSTPSGRSEDSRVQSNTGDKNLSASSTPDVDASTNQNGSLSRVQPIHTQVASSYLSTVTATVPSIEVPSSGMMSIHDIATQHQLSNKQSLIQMVCSQQRAVVSLQYRVAQLESYMGVNVGPQMVPISVGSYLQPVESQLSSINTNVPTATLAEAEAQRYSGRMFSRVAQCQSTSLSTTQSSPTCADSANPPMCKRPPMDPALYWGRVRFLREHYIRVLYVAAQALGQKPPPPNSPQAVKYESINHKINSAIQVLSEESKRTQPRRVEVLDSIEKFIVNMVIPFVRKFQVRSGMVNSRRNASSGMVIDKTSEGVASTLTSTRRSRTGERERFDKVSSQVPSSCSTPVASIQSSVEDFRGIAKLNDGASNISNADTAKTACHSAPPRQTHCSRLMHDVSSPLELANSTEQYSSPTGSYASHDHPLRAELHAENLGAVSDLPDLSAPQRMRVDSSDNNSGNTGGARKRSTENV